MLRPGLTAAGLVVVAVVLVAGGRAQPGRERHVCSAEDRQFLRAAQLATTALALIGQEVEFGRIAARAAVAQTRSSALSLRNTSPVDPSLARARPLLRGMILEYGRAIRDRAAGRDATAHLYRSYSLAAYGRQELAEARAPLAKLGCPVDGLLQE